MKDNELDELLEDAKQGDKIAAASCLLEICDRLLKRKPLTVVAVAALTGGMLALIETGQAARLLAPQVAARRGRPKGSATKYENSLLHALQRYGAANGIVPEEKRVLGSRQAQRIRASLRGIPGKPGRPRKTDKE